MNKLSWLRDISEEDFLKKLKKKKLAETDFLHLANNSLDYNQCEIFFKYLKIFYKKTKKFNKLKEISLGIISSSTADFLKATLIVTALRYGIKLNVYISDYNQITQLAYSNDEIFKNLKLDFILLYIDSKNLDNFVKFNTKKNPKKNLDDFVKFIDSIVVNLNHKTGCEIILSNFSQPSNLIFGSFETKLQTTESWFVSNLNLKLNKFKYNFLHILDINILSSKIGLDNWNDQKLWFVGKIPFHLNNVPIFSEYVLRIVGNRLGKSKRCLICDLDNTLWGGVIGDDGLDGILIGNGDPVSEAHLDLQKTILEIRNRGIALAICSKNSEENALLPFNKHPEMILKEDHFAMVQANWTDKATNIRHIAKTLSLGLESMVFIDDNPVEREQVRQELPEVAVPELPEDASLYSKVLIEAGYFESISFSMEDKIRAKTYEDNSKRQKLLKSSSNMEKFLKDLKMQISFQYFDKLGRPRISQLINKSNQFNLTTKRYSENVIEKLEKDKKYFHRQIRLKDKFGDNGMISVVICEKLNSQWIIDTWLMSCRVLGRNVELATLHNLIDNAKKYEISELVGKYIPTKRNSLVKNHYKNLGFKLKNKKNNCEIWTLNIEKYKYKKLPFKVYNQI